VTKPPITATTRPLHFEELSPLDFERLCLWLIQREGYSGARHLGQAGGEQGRDIVAHTHTPDGLELWYFQCKRYREIGAGTLKKEVDKYNQLVEADPAKRPAGIVFITNAVVSARTSDAVEAYCQKFGYRCEFWAQTELYMLVKKHPEIVREFFSPLEATAAQALHQLPAAPRDFTGRKDELRQLINEHKSGRAIFLLHGMGGVGKTALALKFANRLKASYPDAQFHLDLRGTTRPCLSPAEIQSHVIRAYNPTARLPEDEQ
jgi:hypothetical protein